MCQSLDFIIFTACVMLLHAKYVSRMALLTQYMRQHVLFKFWLISFPSRVQEVVSGGQSPGAAAQRNSFFFVGSQALLHLSTRSLARISEEQSVC